MTKRGGALCIPCCAPYIDFSKLTKLERSTKTHNGLAMYSQVQDEDAARRVPDAERHPLDCSGRYLGCERLSAGRCLLAHAAILEQPAFAQLLKRYRRAAGYSQETLAERCDLSTRAIASLEQGSRRAPYRETVEALADALGLSRNERSLLEEAAARARGRRRREARGLPAPLTSFIERSEVVDLSGLLLDHRLLTITGTGGVGKTRIAIEVSRRIEQRYQDLWFVDLLPVPRGKQLGPYMADLFDLRADDDGDILSEIVRQLRSRSTLLVLDNSEHVIAEARTFVESLLLECPLLTVLVTSREPLRQRGEVTFRLPPMDESAALGLFVARAKAADRSLAFSAERLAIIGAICNELERIPLAIELTASRIVALGFDEILERLNGDTILAASSGLAGRHQTMVATIAWSYDLLSDVDRMLFERLSVFIADFTLAAAEAVCADASLSVAGVADGVQRLVQKSLIEAELVETSMRYRFLESIRSFAWMRFSQTGDAANTMLRLTDWLSRKARVGGTSQSNGQLIQGGWELDVAKLVSYRRRIDPTMIEDVKVLLGNAVRAYVCGPTSLVEAVADALVASGLSAGTVRTEGFGPTGS